MATHIEKHESNRQRILDAALQLFASEGVAESRVIDILQVAGLPKSTFYNYYASRDDILEDLFGRTADALVASLDESRRTAATPEAWLRSVFLHVLDAAGRDSRVLAVLRRTPAVVREFERCSAMAEVRDCLLRNLRSFHPPAVHGPEGDSAIRILCAAVFEALAAVTVTGELDRDRAVELLVGMSRSVLNLRVAGGRPESTVPDSGCGAGLATSVPMPGAARAAA